MTNDLPKFKETLTAHWADPSNYNKGWNARAMAAVNLIADEKWICDLGCGQQAVRSLLQSPCVYLPADLKQWTPDTAVCDLNRNVLPERYLRACDVCLLLGVIEYVWQPGPLFRRLAQVCKTVIFSYNVMELGPTGRHEIWVNAFSVLDLQAMLDSAGFVITRTEPLPDGKQLLFRITSQKHGLVNYLQRKYARHRLMNDKALNLFGRSG
jgi:hypothetical protein